MIKIASRILLTNSYFTIQELVSYLFFNQSYSKAEEKSGPSECGKKINGKHDKGRGVGDSEKETRPLYKILVDQRQIHQAKRDRSSTTVPASATSRLA